MSVAEPLCYPTNLNPTAQEFIPATLINPLPFFFYLHPPPLLFPGSLPPHLPPTSVASSRAVVLISVPTNVTKSALRRDVEVFGEVRGVQMERVEEGIVTVHFYDRRDAETALEEIRGRHVQEQVRFNFLMGVETTSRGLICGRPVWAHFAIPHIRALHDGNNQGTLVIMNLEPSVSSSILHQIFQVYGDVKEIRETPYKKHQRFVEFYDVRDAARALQEMDGKAINGKSVFIQFSRPGGFCKRFFFESRYNRSSIFHHYSPPSPVVISSSMADFSNRRNDNENETEKQNQNQPYMQRYKNNVVNRKLPKKQTKNIRDACFVISEDAGEFRTTVMIKNIPNRFSLKLLLDMLDTHCYDCNKNLTNKELDSPLSSYDFVYLPIDFSNRCNVGYGFVNMTSPEAVWRFYKAFHNQRWGVLKSRKICEGVEKLKEHFKNSRLTGEMEQYMPVVFSPPRNGRLLTEPIPIVDLDISVADGNSGEVTDAFDKTVEGSDGCVDGKVANGGVWEGEEGKSGMNNDGFMQ